MHKNLVTLNLPSPELKLAKRAGEIVVWDDIRKKHLKLTPEEWVRQHFVHYLVSMEFPRSAIALEGGFHLYRKLQRTDILVYKNGVPALLVECKAPQVKITQATFDQAARYNLHHQTNFVVITNGLRHFAARIDRSKEAYIFLKEIPRFHEI